MKKTSSETLWEYRFEVAVDYLLPVQHLKAPQESMGEAADQSDTEALEVVFFYQLIQVHPEERNIMGCLVSLQCC